MDGFTIGSFLASFLASAAHGGNLPVISKIYKFFPKKDNVINHDLQKAVKRSYLSAIQNIAMDCQKELEKDKSFLDRMLPRSDDLNWLKQKRNQTAKALGQLDKEKSVEIPLETLRQIESLFSPSGTVIEGITQFAKDKLTAEALKDERIPEYYAKAVKEKLFDLTCLYFVWEIKHTPEVRHIFQTQLLTQIDATGADTLQRLQNMEDLLLRLCNMFGLQQVPDVRWMLKINLSIQDVMEQLQNVAEKLKQHSKDGSLRVARIEGESNIVLVFEGSKQGFEQIRSLFQSSQLTQMLEIPVAGVEMETVVHPIISVQPTVSPTALRKAMTDAFGLEDLELLCADIQQEFENNQITLPINLEMVGGSGKAGKILKLIEYLDRRGYLSYLVDAVRKERPGII